MGPKLIKALYYEWEKNTDGKGDGDDDEVVHVGSVGV